MTSQETSQASPYYAIAGGRKVRLTEAQAIAMEEDGQQVFIERGPISEHERQLLRDRVGLN